MQATSFHGEGASCAWEDLVSHGDFLDSSPVVLMTPDVAPSQEEEHGNLGDQESPHECLLADHWHEEEDTKTERESVLKSSELVPGHPILQFCKVFLWSVRDVRIMNQEMNKLHINYGTAYLSLLSPAWYVLQIVLPVVGILGWHESMGSGVYLMNQLHFLFWILATVIVIAVK